MVTWETGSVFIYVCNQRYKENTKKARNEVEEKRGGMGERGMGSGVVIRQKKQYDFI